MKSELNIKEEILQEEIPQIPHQEEIPQLQNLVQSKTPTWNDNIIKFIFEYLTQDAKYQLRTVDKRFKKLIDEDIKKSINIIPQIKSAFGETEADFQKIIDEAYNHPLVSLLENAILQKYEVLPLADRINNLAQGLPAQGTEKKALLAGFVIDYVHSISVALEVYTSDSLYNLTNPYPKDGIPNPFNLTLNPHTDITKEKHLNWKVQRFFPRALEEFDRQTLEKLAAYPNTFAALKSIKDNHSKYEFFNNQSIDTDRLKRDFVIFVRNFVSLESDFLSRPYGEARGWSRKKSLSIKNISHYIDNETSELKKASQEPREFEHKEGPKVQICEQLRKEKVAKLADAQKRLAFTIKEQVKQNREDKKVPFSHKDRHPYIEKMQKLAGQEIFNKSIIENTALKANLLDFNKVKLDAKIESNLQDINKYNEYNKGVSAKTIIKYFKQKLLAVKIQEALIQKDAGKDLDQSDSAISLLTRCPEFFVETIDEIKAALNCNIAEAIDVFSKAIIGAILSIEKYDTMKKFASRVLGEELDTEALKPKLETIYRKEIFAQRINHLNKSKILSDEEYKKIEENAQELDQIDFQNAVEEKELQEILQSLLNSSYCVPRTSPKQADKIKALLEFEIYVRLNPESDSGKQYSNFDFDKYKDLKAMFAGEALDPDKIQLRLFGDVESDYESD